MNNLQLRFGEGKNNIFAYPVAILFGLFLLRKHAIKSNYFSRIKVADNWSGTVPADEDVVKWT